MITDNEPSNEVLSKIWNSFFHFFLDEKSHSFLIAQCRSLIEVSESITAWNDSKYSKFIRMCNVNTLVELRRHWTLYVQAGQLPSAEKKRLKEMVLSSVRITKATQHNGSNLFPHCSAGPYFLQSAQPIRQVSQHFWETGITSLSPQDISAATLVNPTFVYSLTGEGFALHYCTTPISPFHLAPAFLNSKRDTPTMPEFVTCAKSQFSSWIKRFRTFVQDKPEKLTIRLFAGDALFLCRALVHHVGTGKIPSNLTVAPWSMIPIALDGGDYGHSDGAPTSFNIIDTSNITDHIGLLNAFIAAAPLLSPAPSATLFTEALQYTREDAAKRLTTQICTDVSTMSLLLDLIPVKYLSNFNTRFNAEETMATKFHIGFRQYHDRTAWKRPTTCDVIITSQPDHSIRVPISFEPQDLCKLLVDIYIKMFAPDEGMFHQFDYLQSLYDPEITHYTRETFVALLAIIKRRTIVDWDSTIASFLHWLDIDRTLTTGLATRQDLCAHLHLAGVYTAEFIRTPVAKEGRFLEWTQIPPTVSVILVVPRNELRVLLDVDPNEVGVPVFRVELVSKHSFFGSTFIGRFASPRMGFGRVTSSGTDACPEVVFEPDSSSWAGTSPLIVSFSVPSCRLHIGDPDEDNTVISLTLDSESRTDARFGPKLGLSLKIFTLSLMDRSQVFVVPDEPQGLDESLEKVFDPNGHQENPVSVTIDPECSRATTFTSRANITDVPTRDILPSGAEVSCHQASPCVMEVRIGQTRQSLVYPLPVIGSRSKLRVAKESFYVEVCRLYSPINGSTLRNTVQVVVPIAEPLQPDGFSLNRFPIPLTDKVGAPWNFHHLQLDRLPILDISNKPRIEWIRPQLTFAFTKRELALKERGIHTDTLTNVKLAFGAILLGAAGMHERKSQVFGLNARGIFDTVIFVPTFRFDLASHTIVADAYVLPLNRDRLRTVEIARELIYKELQGDDIAAWKRLLPVLAERCRTWKHGPNCEFLAKKSIPLSLEPGNDPLCSCGKGKDVSAAFMKEKKWASAAPFVTRIAISPIFGVPCVEGGGVFPDTPARRLDEEPEKLRDRCANCGGTRKPKLLVCGGCKSIGYCSAGCQKEDWKKHKSACKK